MRENNTHAVASIANPTAPRFLEEQPENFIIAGTGKLHYCRDSVSKIVFLYLISQAIF